MKASGQMRPPMLESYIGTPARSWSGPDLSLNRIRKADDCQGGIANHNRLVAKYERNSRPVPGQAQPGRLDFLI